jgi:hypothetical protein
MSTEELVNKVRILDDATEGCPEIKCAEEDIPNEYATVVALLNAAKDENGDAYISYIGYSYQTNHTTYILYATWKKHLQPNS